MTSKLPPIERFPLWAIILTCATIAAIGMGVRQSMGLYLKPVSYTHLTLPTKVLVCRSRWSPYH